MEIVTQTRTFFSKAPVFVLDASFNPPHRAHYALARLAALHYAQLGPTQLGPVQVNVVLSYAALNADKGTASITDQRRREAMIKNFSTWFFGDQRVHSATTRTKVEWAVAIVRAASPKFVDKCRDLSTLLGKCDGFTQENEEIKDSSDRIVFLMGFDTLVRLLDPKYYPGENGKGTSIVPQLNGFFKMAQVWALPRGETEPLATKARWLTAVADGSVAFPEWWAQRVDILDPAAVGDDEDGSYKVRLSDVSSTRVRAAAHDGDWDTVLDIVDSPEVCQYIQENHLYAN
ncbi:uncharacterized protein SAPINGB_P002113 [Magnusiomyces paraingens]|uniref:Nicotinamide-nucleotide adenylyltransferase n=1 Tax=Magnusiomyces paraingens TaxID=2606893 RepID=A0A5E8BDL3_9ASCO|nr:uncharacterized protein SAPINGB_P002113 [Saprochaete ingens]VVT49119.1 unnamed protein product [Saprochaete ingens]